MDEHDRYRLMIYFAVTVLHYYRASIVAVRGPQTPAEFAKRNEQVLAMVRTEALRLFNYQYELDDLMRAIEIYLNPSQEVSTTKILPLP